MRGLRTKEKNLREKNNLSSEHKVFDKEKEKILSVDFVKQEPLPVLHSDDDSSFLKVSNMILELESNFSVDTATSVDEAFCKLKTQQYDAVVFDLGMPLKDGLDFLKELIEQKTEIEFIIFTDKGMEEDVIRAINLGANYYIEKRGVPETVYRELKNAIIDIVKPEK